MKTKKEFRYFTIFNHEKEEEYLREQHQHGWKFIRVTGLGMYHFEECQPEDVIYQLDFNEESKTNHASYVQMFSDCGWEYIQEYVGYSYFRKPVADMKDEEEIFCDESSRLAMLERVFKRRMLPVFIDRKKRLFSKTRIIFGRPYEPVYTGRKGTAEEYQANAEEIMRRVYELGETE